MFITALAVSVILFGAFLLALWNGVKHDEVGEKAGNMAVGAIVFLFLFVFAALFFVSSGYGHPKSFYRVSTTTWRVLSVATNGQSVYVVASQHDGAVGFYKFTTDNIGQVEEGKLHYVHNPARTDGYLHPVPQSSIYTEKQ